MPLISIVIPTCDRPQYLLKVIELITANLSNYEVIIADNSSSDKLKDDLAFYLSKDNFTYSYVSQKLSVVDNFERTLDLINGEYVCFLGDDDGIGPGFEHLVEWAKNHNIDALYSYNHNGFICNYFWPGVQSKYLGSAYNAKLFVNSFSGVAIEVNPRTAIDNVMNNPGAGLQDLPRIYHGIVKSSVLKKVKSRFGHVFGGISPDIYSGMLVASECKSVFRVDYPFIIPGACVLSTAGQGAEKSDVGDLNKVDHITRFGENLKWPDVIPRFYSPSNVWACSLYAATECIGLNASDIKFEHLYALSLVRYFGYRPHILKSFRLWSKEHGFINSSFRVLFELIFEFKFQMYRIIRKLNKLAFSERAFECIDIVEAYDMLNNYIKENDIKLGLR